MIFILFLGVVLVKSQNLHHLHKPHHHHHHHHHHHNDLPDFFDDPLFPGFFGVGLFGSDIFGNGGSQPGGYIAPVNNYDGDIEQGGNHSPLNGGNNAGVYVPGQSNVNYIEQPNEPDSHLNIASREPPTPDIQGLNSHANEVPVNNVNKPNLDNHVDINESQLNIVPDYAEGPKINFDLRLNTAAGDDVLSGLTKQTETKENNGNLLVRNVPGFLDDDIKKGIVMASPELKYNINESHEPKVLDDAKGYHSNVNTVQGLDSKTKPEEKIDNSIGNDETVLRFTDNDNKKDTLMVDPELKNNDTDSGLNKYSDSVVYPDDVNEAKKQSQVQQNLPNKLNVGDNDKKYPSVVAPGVAPTTAPSNYENPSQWTPSNSNALTSNNQGTQNQYTNQPNSFVFLANPNQQVPVNNGNGSPYVNVVRNPNGDYTIVNIPNNNGKPGQIYESETSNGNSALNNPGQFYYISGNSEINSPSQGYISGNSGLNNLNQIYVPVNGNSGVNNAGQTYVIANGANSGVNNPGQTYVIADGTNSGVNNPSQTYLIANGANSGLNTPGQVYVPVNSGANNPGSTYVPPFTGQTTNGVYYNVIQLSNGQTILVPVNNGNGQNAQWSGQSNNGQIYVPVNYNPGQGNNPTGNVVPFGSSGNVVTGGSTNNVPLLISYKDKDGEDKEKNVKVDQLKHEEKEE